MRTIVRAASSPLVAVLCLSLFGVAFHGGPDPGTAPVPSPGASTPAVSLVARTTQPAGATSEAQQMLQLVNAERAKTSCRPVRLDARLNAAATKHSRDMATRNYFSHTSPDGATFAVRIRREGYPAPRSENIAAGSRTAQATFRQWMNSAGHRANILDCRAKDMGVGVGSASGSRFGTYWTQVFGFGTA